MEILRVKQNFLHFIQCFAEQKAQAMREVEWVAFEGTNYSEEEEEEEGISQPQEDSSDDS